LHFDWFSAQAYLLDNLSATSAHKTRGLTGKSFNNNILNISIINGRNLWGKIK